MAAPFVYGEYGALLKDLVIYQLTVVKAPQIWRYYHQLQLIQLAYKLYYSFSH